MDLHLAQIVYEDLDYLIREWNQDIDEQSLRRATPILRRLLIDQEQGLTRISRMLGGNQDLLITAPSINIDRLDELIFFCAGGAKTPMGIIESIQMFSTLAKSEERPRMMVGEESPIKLSKFLKQTSLVISSVKINREEIIKYVSNKLGGVHYDSNRDDRKELEKKYILMDQIGSGRVMLMDKNIVYYELLSIGQYLINSPSIRALAENLGRKVREHLLPP
jgi:hypothetical protein